MTNFLDISRCYQNQWVVLDAGHNVLDHGEDFAALRARHAGARRTFYFASSL